MKREEVCCRHFGTTLKREKVFIRRVDMYDVAVHKETREEAAETKEGSGSEGQQPQQFPGQLKNHHLRINVLCMKTVKWVVFKTPSNTKGCAYYRPLVIDW